MNEQHRRKNNSGLKPALILLGLVIVGIWVAVSNHQPYITTELLNVTTDIPYKSVTNYDSNLELGESNTTAGSYGSRTTQYKVTKSDGKETSRSQVSSYVTKEAVDEVKVYGTKSTYVPPATTTTSYSNSNGATTQCHDGTLSYSAHRQGTCSHHGGVATWY